MSKKKHDPQVEQTNAETENSDEAHHATPARTRKPKPTGSIPLSEKMRITGRIVKQLEGLDAVQQRGIVGIIAILQPSHVGVLFGTLKLLSGVPETADRSAIVNSVVGVLGVAATAMQTTGEATPDA